MRDPGDQHVHYSLILRTARSNSDTDWAGERREVWVCLNRKPNVQFILFVILTAGAGSAQTSLRHSRIRRYILPTIGVTFPWIPGVSLGCLRNIFPVNVCVLGLEPHTKNTPLCMIPIFFFLQHDLF